MGTDLDLDDVAATSETAKRELSSLRGLLVASHRRCTRLETALRRAADEPNIDRARAIADAALANERVEQLRQECNLLSDVLRDAYDVIKTIEGDNSDEDERLWDLRMTIEAALSGYDKDRIEK